jgi:hypothetical protein
MDKFATALQLRWPWLEWKDNTKIWAGTGNPCNENDMQIFYAATTITLGNGRKTPFWHAPWLEGMMPKEIVPFFLRFARERIGKWRMLFMRTSGLKSLASGQPFPSSTSLNLCNYGSSSKMCI